MPWWVAIAGTVVLSALLTWEETGSIVGAAIAAVMALGVGTGGVVVYRRRKGRKNPPTSALSVLLSLAVGLGLVACLGMAAGCGSTIGHRVASGTALCAVEVEHGAAVGFQIASAEIRADLADEGRLSLETWCEAVRPAWEVAAKVQCSAAALADLARGADAVMAAGEDVSVEWIGAACAALRAATETWEVATDDEVPDILLTVRDLACGLAGPWRPEEAPCEIGPVPGCEGVSP